MDAINKRQFLRGLASVGMYAFFPQYDVDKMLETLKEGDLETLTSDESFWREMRKAYVVTKDFIQLENGYYSLAAQEVLSSYINHIERINAVSSYYMRTQQWDDKLSSRKELARLLGCTEQEVIITRNTTESLDTIIAGIDWKTGDEALMAEQDYGAMLDMFALQAKRYGIVNKKVSIPNHPASDEEIVSLYENAITPKTRLLMICHMVNITGHILPVRKIVDMAHKHGVEVLVDGAHAFGHIDFQISELDCDYYGSSLHKWLGVPLGAGLLYVKKEKIAGIWQMFGDMGFADDDIRKLNHTGTHPVATDIAIQDAIRFHEKIGIQRKEARLRYLQRYWTDKVRNHPRIILNTPEAPHRSCGIANVGIEGMKPGDLAKRLMEAYKIFTVAIERGNVQGIRVTPHLYTSTQELDIFVGALKALAG